MLERSSWLESKVSEGGTSLARVREQLTRARCRLAGRGEQAIACRRRSAATFYAAPVLEVARELIGCTVEHAGSSGVIVETEAYHESEPACHAYAGLTPRTRTLFGEPGRAYVYRSYGIHALLNAVCEPAGVGAAVLIRALAPLAGIERMRARRGARRARGGPLLGPGQAHAGARHRARRSTAASLRRGPIRIRAATDAWAEVEVLEAPRVGITRAVELHWRFCAAGSRHVSRPWPRAAEAR